MTPEKRLPDPNSPVERAARDATYRTWLQARAELADALGMSYGPTWQDLINMVTTRSGQR